MSASPQQRQTVAERVRAIRIDLSNPKMGLFGPMSNHDKNTLSLVARGLLRLEQGRWRLPGSPPGRVPAPAIERLVQRGYVVIGGTGAAPTIGATIAGRRALEFVK